MESKFKLISRLTFVLALLATQACEHRSTNGATNNLSHTDEFKNYWYSGLAEINIYELDQSRYGENRKGKAVLIFVTEDFSKSKLVKLDDPARDARDAVSVLKLNFTKNFNTGVYPYSMMLSTFTPIDRQKFPHTLKATMTTQEWCGHVFTQLNAHKDLYRVETFSYFEQEGDEKFPIDKSLLEDELFTLIRLSPDNLPSGDQALIPGLFHTRMRHLNLKPQTVNFSQEENENTRTFVVTYPADNRKISITFESAFPHKILSWVEQFYEKGNMQETRAVLQQTMRLDYWTKNKNEYLPLRDSLGLTVY